MRLFLLVALSLCVASLNAQRGLIVKFKSDPSPEKNAGIVSWTGNFSFDQLAAENGAEKFMKHREGRKSESYFFTIAFATEAQRDRVLSACRGNNSIAYAEADAAGSAGGTQQITPNDASYGNQWSLKNNGSFPLSAALTGADIDMENAWNITTGSSTVVVGTIDSGLRLGHPEFSGRLWVNAGEIPNNGTDDDANGFIDDINGWDFANADNDPTDDQGHGTNVTGIIGANGNNGIGYAGVDWQCKLMTLKGLDANGSGWYSWWADALYYATDNGVDVINMSLGGNSTSTTLQNAINYAVNNNVTVVACMMNFNNSTVYYPAGFPGVIAVGATNPDDTRANPFFWSNTSGSNYGSHISVAAPGNYIYGLSYTSDTYYGSYWGGTSQAAPHVAGIASLLLAVNPAFTPAQIKSIIESSAEDQVGLASEDVVGWDQYFGHGRVNAHQALLSTGMSNAHTAEQELQLWPVPAQDMISFTNNAETASYTLYDLHGKTAATGVVNGSGVHRIDCSAMERGCYFFVLEMPDRSRIIRKLVLN
jgi:subtilisin family serine protease